MEGGMESRFVVVPYSIGNLTEIFADKSGTPREDVEEKDHYHYLEEYFEELEAASILVEPNYVDHDFLEDFAEYYVKCFYPYQRICTRLHFFKTAFKTEDVVALLVSGQGPLSIEVIQESYLGFLIVKPIPQTFIGRTCLTCYPSEGGRRYYPATRLYEAHLFGMTLRVNSLAFQEQDTVVAACATNALWSAFQATGKLFHHYIPSPVEITKAASVTYDVDTRTLPSSGLTPVQMAQSIRSVSLEPHLINVYREEHVLKGNVYAYVKGQIPLLLSVRLHDRHPSAAGSVEQALAEPDSADESPDSADESLPDEDKEGIHSVAVTGFSLGLTDPQPLVSTGLLLRASRIDKLYVHDDQIGPFARMEFENGDLTTSWRSETTGTIGDTLATPLDLLVPLYHKIRIPFDLVHDAIGAFDEFIEALREESFLSYSSRVEWDIYLVLGSKFKEVLLGDASLTAEQRDRWLFCPLPRFVWRATALKDASAVLDLLFDATDVPQGKLVIGAVEYDPEISLVLREVCKNNSLIESFKRDHAGRILEWFAGQTVLGEA